MAARLGAAVVLITHHSKHGASGTNGKYRVLGSIAYVGVCRANFLFLQDPDDPTGRRRLMLDNGGNLAPRQPGLAYVIRDDGAAPFCDWLPETIDLDADAALARAVKAGKIGASSRLARRHECQQWLRGYLAERTQAGQGVRAGRDGGGIQQSHPRACTRGPGHPLAPIGFRQGRLLPMVLTGHRDRVVRRRRSGRRRPCSAVDARIFRAEHAEHGRIAAMLRNKPPRIFVRSMRSMGGPRPCSAMNRRAFSCGACGAWADHRVGRGQRVLVGASGWSLRGPVQADIPIAAMDRVVEAEPARAGVGQGQVIRPRGRCPLGAARVRTRRPRTPPSTRSWEGEPPGEPGAPRLGRSLALLESREAISCHGKPRAALRHALTWPPGRHQAQPPGGLVPGWLAGPLEVAVNGERAAALAGRRTRLGDRPPREALEQVVVGGVRPTTDVVI